MACLGAPVARFGGTTRCRLAGKHCESSDVIVDDVLLDDPRPGDLIVTPATGAYGYAVPVNAPLVAPYVVPPAALVFAPNTAAAGRYVVEASGAGVVKTAASPTLAGGATFSADFALP